MARKVVLAGACRTAIGTMGGTLSNTPAPDLGTVVIKEALKRAGVAQADCKRRSRYYRGRWYGEYVKGSLLII